MIFNYSKHITRLCGMLIGVLGFASCGDNKEMYGTPTGSFQIKGKVTAEDGAPVGNAEIRVTEPNQQSGIYSDATVHTSAEGDYTAKGETFPSDKIKVVCIPEDKSLEPDSVLVPMNYIDDNDNTWDSGHADAVVDFKLKAKGEKK